jgi:hypothetical protein
MSISAIITKISQLEHKSLEFQCDKNGMSKCPICCEGDVIVGSKITNDEMFNNSFLASCTNCTSTGFITNFGMCYAWHCNSLNGKYKLKV